MLKINFFHFYISFLFIFIFISQTKGQIKGRVTDINNNAVFANIILKRALDSTVSVYSQTDPLGYYSLKIKEIGAFFIGVKSLNYTIPPKFLKIEKINEEHIINFKLQEKNIQLDEIIIKSYAPIKSRNDTITISAKAFATGNEDVIEDLMKKIPGLFVSSDGVIKYNNQEVEKVMVEGDDFFEKGYRILTKNMTAKPIDKIQILLNYSNNKLLKNIEESNKIAINLTLDEEAKRQWFGNIELGNDIFFNKFHQGRVNLMSFDKKSKYYFLGSSNSTGTDITGDLNSFTNSYSYNEPGRIGDDVKISDAINLNPDFFNFSSNRANFNDTQLISLNAIFNPNKRIKIKTNGFVNWNNENFIKTSKNIFFGNNTNFTNIESYQLNNSKLTSISKTIINYDISKNQTIKSETSYSYKTQNDKSLLDFNGESTTELLGTFSNRFNHNSIYTNKLSDKKVFLISGRIINESSQQEYNVNQVFFDELFTNIDFQPDQVNQDTNNRLFYGGINIHYLDRKSNGDLFELSLGNEYHRYQFENTFRLIESETSNQSTPINYQNSVVYILNDLNLKLKYQKEWKKKYKISGNIELHQMFNELKTSDVINQNPLFINPKLNFSYKINKNNKVGFGLFYNVTNASILDIYNNFFLTGFRSFKRGTGTFNQLDSSGGSFRYQLGNWTDKFFTSINVNYTKNHNFLSSNQQIKQNVFISERIIIKNRELLKVSTTTDYYFSKLMTNLKVKNEYNITNFTNIVNDSELRQVQNRNYNFGLELRSAFNGKFNFHLGTTFNFINVTINDNEFSNSFTNNNSFVDLSLILSELFDIQIKGEHFFFDNINGGVNNYFFIDSDIRYTPKNSKWSYSIMARNLTDTTEFKNGIIGDVSSTTIIYNLLPKYILINFKYRF